MGITKYRNRAATISKRMTDDAEADREALAGARRVYDRQITTLDSIDDKAMRTARTAVLILGFVAAALTAGGPAALSEISTLPVAIAFAGVLGIFGAAFVSVGIYTVTEYPIELRQGDLLAASRVPDEDWIAGAIGRLDRVSTEIESEIDQNARYLEYAQIFLLFGSLLLLYSTAITVISRSYGIEPKNQTLVVLLIVGFGIIIKDLVKG